MSDNHKNSKDEKKEDDIDWENDPYLKQYYEEEARLKAQTEKEEQEHREREESEMNSDNEDEKKEDDEDEDEEESKYIQPIVDGRNITFKTRILNQYLVCSLCMGYYRDAMTIKECLHTFCKSCIYKYFVDCGSACPHCEVRLGTNPYELIKYDRQIQAIVDKIFPELEVKDAEAEREFYKVRGIEPQEPVPPAGKYAETSTVKRPVPSSEDSSVANEEQTPNPLAKKLKKSEVEKKFYADEVAFELNLDESEKEDSLKKLDKPFIRTSAKVTILHLKKIFKEKIGY